MSLLRLAFSLVFICTSAGLAAQQQQQIVVPASALPKLEAMKIEPDHGSSASRIIATVSPVQMIKIERQGIEFEVLPRQQTGLYTMSLETWLQRPGREQLVPHDAYVSYELYEYLLSDLAQRYSHICHLHELGTLESGYRILALEITDHPDQEEEEPKVLYTSTMHGDELAGFPIMLMLIEELLLQYEQNPEINALINGTEIWINPLANPDGTYAGGSHSVEGATRRNRNGVDLNRNFPDPNFGDHPDGHEHQAETEIFMELHEHISFDLSCNLHSGAEVFNYPWDTYGQLHPDNDWWQHIGREFANHMQGNSEDHRFFRQLDNGITNGYSWYHVKGGRQDYVTYFHHGREATLEIEGQKAFSPRNLDRLWQTSRPALLAYIQQAGFGLRGTITDAESGAPVLARIAIPGHDDLNSEVYSKLPTGRYHRYLKAGTYTFEISAEGYETQTITKRVIDQAATYLNIKLQATDVR